MPAWNGAFGLNTMPGGADFAQTPTEPPPQYIQPIGPAPATTTAQSGIGPGTPGWGAFWNNATNGSKQPGLPNVSAPLPAVGGAPGAGPANGTTPLSTSWQDMLSSFGSNSFGSLGQFRLDPALQSAFQFALGQGMGAYNPGQQYYSGQLTPNLTPDDLQAQALMRQLSGQLQGQTGSYYNLLSNAMGRATGAAPSGALQPAIDATAKDLTQQYTNVGGVRDSTRQQFVGAGQYGSAKQQVSEALNNRGFEDVLARTVATMRLNDQQQGAQQSQSLLGLMPAMSSLQTMPAQLLSAVGGQNREQQGNINNEGFNRWAFGLYEPQRQLQNLLGTITGSLPLGGVNVSQSVQPDWYTELQRNMLSTNLANAQGGQSGGSGSNILAGLIGAGSLWNLFK